MRLKENSNEIIFSSDERISDGGWGGRKPEVGST